jgi:1-acyl-sn-glycerol-3-phosphate acyltransferase
MHRVPLAAAAATLALLVPAAPVLADGPRPISPSNGKTQRLGVPFTFKVSDPSEGSVFIAVSKSRAKRADGTLKDQATWFRKMGGNRGTRTKKVERYQFLTSHFLNRRGKWYWQAWRIDCAEQEDCNVEGPIRSFTIR